MSRDEANLYADSRKKARFNRPRFLCHVRKEATRRKEERDEGRDSTNKISVDLMAYEILEISSPALPRASLFFFPRCCESAMNQDEVVRIHHRDTEHSLRGSAFVFSGSASPRLGINDRPTKLFFFVAARELSFFQQIARNRLRNLL